jgi:hypothetical protein
MKKIPVGATIAQAYRFVFAKFFSILSIVWLPIVVLGVGGLLVTRQSAIFSGAMAGRNLSALGPALMVLLPFYILALLLILMQIVGITEQALGTRKGSPFFYINVGRPLWLLAGTVLLFVLLFVGVALAAGLGASLLTLLVKLLSGVSRALSVLFLVVGMLAVYLGLIYVTVRLSFLMTPVVVAENRIGLGRAWQLGKGNFWRMFLVLLAILVPVLATEMIFLFGFLFSGMPPAAPPGASPAQLQATQAAMQAWSAGMTARMNHYWFVTYPFFLVISLLLYGLLSGAQAFAYRALVPDHLESAEAFS